ncbi:hypothetical protein [Pseudodesulfovibrio sp.]|uniref:hypothetical protein n=1 Tax=unclassified Pseudodesulfovibrio TaxID=2661612 RepID=UPI003B009D1E
MANFNQFVIRGLLRCDGEDGGRLLEANFLLEKPMLRLVLKQDAERTSVVYLVYMGIRTASWPWTRP